VWANQLPRWKMAMKWKLWTRTEGSAPPIEAFHTEQYASKDAALEAAYQMMFGPARSPHTLVPYILEPNGDRIDSEKIDAWCKARPS
jgi:hypothetical protein